MIALDDFLDIGADGVVTGGAAVEALFNIVLHALFEIVAF